MPADGETSAKIQWQTGLNVTISKHMEEEGRQTPAAGLQVSNANVLSAGCRK